MGTGSIRERRSVYISASGMSLNPPLLLEKVPVMLVLLSLIMGSPTDTWCGDVVVDHSPPPSPPPMTMLSLAIGVPPPQIGQ